MERKARKSAEREQGLKKYGTAGAERVPPGTGAG